VEAGTNYRWPAARGPITLYMF